MASKESESQGYGLLISAVVAIVAIVGQVILFNSGGSGSSTGLLVEMSGSPPPYPSGIGQNMMRGYRQVRMDTCPSGYGLEDLATGDMSCGTQATFGSGLAGIHYQRYSGVQDEPHGHMSDSGMSTPYSGESQGDDSFNRGAYGKGVRQDIDRTTLPADTTRDGEQLQLG